MGEEGDLMSNNEESIEARSGEVGDNGPTEAQERPYSCESCSKAFKTERGLQAHRRACKAQKEEAKAGHETETDRQLTEDVEEVQTGEKIPSSGRDGGTFDLESIKEQYHNGQTFH